MIDWLRVNWPWVVLVAAAPILWAIAVPALAVGLSLAGAVAELGWWVVSAPFKLLGHMIDVAKGRVSYPVKPAPPEAPTRNVAAPPVEVGQPVRATRTSARRRRRAQPQT